MFNRLALVTIIALLMILVTQRSQDVVHAQNQAAYKFVEADNVPESLNAASATGWELVSASPTLMNSGVGMRLIFLKR